MRSLWNKLNTLRHIDVDKIRRIFKTTHPGQWTLQPSDAIWRHIIALSFVQVMACHLLYYLSQYRFSVVWTLRNKLSHYSDVIMGAMTSQITSLTIVYSTVYSGADQRKHQRSASLVFVRGIHRSSVNFPHKWPVTQKMFPFDDIIMIAWKPFASANQFSLVSWHKEYGDRRNTQTVHYIRFD